MAIPHHTELFNPMLEAMRKLGGSASNDELNEEVISHLQLSPEELAMPHGERGTEIEYWLGWARSYLKIFGLLNNSSRGVWSLTPKGTESSSVDPREVARFVNNRSRYKPNNGTSNPKVEQRLTAPHDPAVALGTTAVENAEAVLEESWREHLMTALKTMHPSAFERLCQRLLRESGFTEVKVTGRPGDGGIDGVGIVQLGDLLSFPVFFQCKRYQSSVGSEAIRNFRGAMMGRGDRGILITTGTFTPDARKEANRDGVPPIDLVDGDRLMDRLKKFQLGVSVRMIEEVTVFPEFFETI